MNVEEFLTSIADQGVTIGLKVVGAIVLFIVGRWLIKFANRLLGKALHGRGVDVTIAKYASSALGVVLNVTLIIAILGYFGVETTSFAAVLAAAGVAIGMAWSGLLAHMAAGVFMVGLRPFKVGDYVIIGGVEGTVREIGLFVTALDTPDNIRTILGNNAVFSGTIKNFSANDYRRVELKAQLAHDADHAKAVVLLEQALAKIDNVRTDPAPSITVLDFTLAGPVLAVRPFCHTDHYWQVYFDTNKAIRETLGGAGFSIPEQHLHVKQSA